MPKIKNNPKTYSQSFRFASALPFLAFKVPLSGSELGKSHFNLGLSGFDLVKPDVFLGL